MARLDGKVALTTGAASGIGLASAQLFAAEGAKVIGADIQDDLGERRMAEIGGDTAYVHCDVSRAEDVEHAVGLAVEKYGRLDCMFNNAGAPGQTALIGDTDPGLLRSSIDTLLVSVFLGMKYAAPVMSAQGSGTIINTASVAGLGVGFGGHIYTACKAAIIHLTRSVANELGEHGVRVNCIAPGSIPTAIFGRGAGLDQEQSEAIIPMLVAGMATTQPVQRAGTPEDIAEAAVWLASDTSGYVTGHCMVVDGGLLTGKPLSQRLAEAEAAAAGAPSEETQPA